jgi:RNA polymerase sigma factor (TIGR02999 family)
MGAKILVIAPPQLCRRESGGKLLISKVAKIRCIIADHYRIAMTRREGEDGQEAPSPQITELLQAWSAGNQSAVGQIIELVYPELHQMARKHLYNERPEHSIQATALVNEAYLRLVNIRRVQWKDRAHFLAVGARIMRRILVDYARARPPVARTELTETLAIAPELDLDLVLLDQALQALAEFDPRKAQVVEMKFFGGLTAEEIAAVLNVSPQTVHRDWSLAKAWLVHEMKHEGDHGPATMGKD